MGGSLSLVLVEHGTRAQVLGLTGERHSLVTRDISWKLTLHHDRWSISLLMRILFVFLISVLLGTFVVAPNPPVDDVWKVQLPGNKFRTVLPSDTLAPGQIVWVSPRHTVNPNW